MFKALMQSHLHQTCEQIQQYPVVLLLVQETTEMDLSHCAHLSDTGQEGNQGGEALIHEVSSTSARKTAVLTTHPAWQEAEGCQLIPSLSFPETNRLFSNPPTHDLSSSFHTLRFPQYQCRRPHPANNQLSPGSRHSPSHHLPLYTRSIRRQIRDHSTTAYSGQYKLAEQRPVE
ncbi:hypothetical protein EI42_03119 [Thermosporothrix hazakensis]|uniref:Uncharacterized protein n=1 Tax=Thermosporothrix hazakensis TaxID=644383 RepID=A0A326UEB5_THEHA|nr:hypothetical protein EI42_03119 [Thermosporothrix hazakensis]